MPYIPKEDRPPLDQGDIAPVTAGDLNYCISRYCNEYVHNHGLSYATLNEIVGVLECAKQEFLRRVVAPYEDTKIEKNGDVYDPGVRGSW